MYIAPATPYCGFSQRPDGSLYIPESGPHVRISGPTGIGKTRRLLVPAITMWGFGGGGGPAVVVSSKDDLMELVCERRWGPKAVIDLRPDYSPVYPPGVDVITFDPTSAISTPGEALTVAETIMQMATVGFGSLADQVSDGGTWESQAAGPLAAILYAASPVGNGGGINWVLRAVDNIAVDGDAVAEPGWMMAAACVREFEVLALGMMRVLQMPDRQRDSVAITMRKAVTPWLRATFQKGVVRTFDPTFLDDPHATLFVISPADGTGAGAAVTLLDSLVRVWRGKVARKEKVHRLLMAIDELPNTAPIPSLRRIIGEARGLEVDVLAAHQADSQLDTVFGPTYANELREIFPTTVIMYGAQEFDTLEVASKWSGETTRRDESFGKADGHKGLNGRFGPVLTAVSLLPEDTNHARMLLRGTPGINVEIPDWLEFRRRYDEVMRKLLAGHKKTSPELVAAAHGQLTKFWMDDRQTRR
ncbi:type IV secretory pathway, VirD4 component [Mycobacteroides abscessus subsp. abscessus]|uniref:type IV secretory system conjugative DNA transfer family protein n=1 Tax=Mycobacteroides abscessus TaxID=36809 RepID=UPI0009A6B8B2|nr:type IV secretory system conjugative DNA transfer family protein [Mycobacteroides abscessus]SLI20063.1 type IV secretory pathway, VirD4 component [Mycobacteroides abscessus subsp. abscessus]